MIFMGVTIYCKATVWQYIFNYIYFYILTLTFYFSVTIQFQVYLYKFIQITHLVK